MNPSGKINAVCETDSESHATDWWLSTNNLDPANDQAISESSCPLAHQMRLDPHKADPVSLCNPHPERGEELEEGITAVHGYKGGEKELADWCRIPPIAREGLNAASRCKRINHLRSRIS